MEEKTLSELFYTNNPAMGGPDGNSPNTVGAAIRWLVRELHTTLNRLNTDVFGLKTSFSQVDRAAERHRVRVGERVGALQDAHTDLVARVSWLEQRLDSERPPGDPMAGRVAVEHANGLWKRATGCAAPAEAQNLIFRLRAKIERMGRDREHPNSGGVYSTGKAPTVDIELLRRCYRAMLLGQHDQAGQLDSAAMALAEAYPEVAK
jgi:hypothetical protein